VYGASLDDVATQAEFAKKHELSFPLLSDPDGSVAAKYDAMTPGKPYTNRLTFILDPEGVLRHVDKSVKVDEHGKDVADVIRRLKQP
jgi:peroxiredoxin Q/BCP